ncbi:MAG TPA: hypothetical protein VF193_06115 [Steroidobacter sp.]
MARRAGQEMKARHSLLILSAASLLVMVSGCASIPNRPARPASSSYGCMAAVVREKLPEGLPERRAHCLAAGLIARHCSTGEAYLAGAGKELRDLLGKGEAAWEDWRADRAGIDCARSASNDWEVAQCCAERGY